MKNKRNRIILSAVILAVLVILGACYKVSPTVNTAENTDFTDNTDMMATIPSSPSTSGGEGEKLPDLSVENVEESTAEAVTPEREEPILTISDNEKSEVKNVEKAETVKKETDTPKADISEEKEDADGIKTEEPDEKQPEKELKCTLSVRCDSILDNMEKLKAEKTEIVPSDGVIFPESEVVFYEGESVFNVLAREMKKNKIHIEFEQTPMYNTVYIEGIANIYEHDCGEMSGWVYLVNGKSLPYGCSQRFIEAGDKIEWIYTCGSSGVTENGR